MIPFADFASGEKYLFHFADGVTVAVHVVKVTRIQFIVNALTDMGNNLFTGVKSPEDTDALLLALVEIEEVKTHNVIHGLTVGIKNVKIVKDILTVRVKDVKTLKDILPVRVKDVKTLKDILTVRVKDVKTLKDILTVRVKDVKTLKDILTVIVKDVKTLKDILTVRVKNEKTLKDILTVRVKDVKTLKDILTVRVKNVKTLKDILTVRVKNVKTLKDILTVGVKTPEIRDVLLVVATAVVARFMSSGVADTFTTFHEYASPLSSLMNNTILIAFFNLEKTRLDIGMYPASDGIFSHIGLRAKKARVTEELLSHLTDVLKSCMAGELCFVYEAELSLLNKELCHIIQAKKGYVNENLCQGITTRSCILEECCHFREIRKIYLKETNSEVCKEFSSCPLSDVEIQTYKLENMLLAYIRDTFAITSHPQTNADNTSKQIPIECLHPHEVHIHIPTEPRKLEGTSEQISMQCLDIDAIPTQISMQCLDIDTIPTQIPMQCLDIDAIPTQISMQCLDIDTIPKQIPLQCLDLVEEAVVKCVDLGDTPAHAPSEHLHLGRTPKQGTNERFDLDMASNKAASVRLDLDKNEVGMQVIPEVASSKTGGKSSDDPEEVLDAMFGTSHFTPQTTDIIVAMMKRAQTQKVIHGDLAKEINRLATFNRVQASHDVFLIPLANNGFFFPACGNSEVVECVLCAVAVPLSRFQGRLAKEVHRELSPQCPFVLGKETGNVPISLLAQTVGNSFMNEYRNSLTSSHSSEVLVNTTATVSGPRQTISTANASRVASLDLAIDGEPLLDNLDTPSLAPKNTSFEHSPSLSTTSLPDIPVLGLTPGQTVVDSKSTLHPPNPSLSTAITTGFPALQTATYQPQSAINQPQTIINQVAINQPQAATHLLQTATSPLQTATTPLQTATYQPQTTTSSADTPNNREPQGPSNNSNTNGSGSSDERKVVTFEQLGIHAQRPKRPDMAVSTSRLNTFAKWPCSDTHPPQTMVDAGFFYTGSRDLVRCFHCKGGLKSWDAMDDPWVEHGRWFPTCPYVLLCKGQKFLDAIKALCTPNNETNIPLKAVELKMKEIIEIERRNKNLQYIAGELMPTPDEVEKVAKSSQEDLEELLENLEEENQELKTGTICKICQTEKVNILLLPCGHLIACAHCAPALRTCAICRQTVKGAVRVKLEVEES